MREIRLIGEDGEQLGVLATIDALRSAREKGVDLVEVAPNAVPPVCRMLDYGRFKYEQEKKDREARKNQKIVLMKEVRLRPKTDEHDLAFKAKQIERFVDEGDRVKVTLRFRGREMAHPNLGRKLLEEMADLVKDVAAVERMPLQEGNTMTMILTKAKPGQAAQVRPAVPGAPGPVPAPAAVGRPPVAAAVGQPPVAAPSAPAAAPAPQAPAAAPSAATPPTPKAPAG